MQLTQLSYYIDNPEDSDANFNLALEYDSLGQTGAALSFYLRAAERATDDLKQYEALLKCARCFDRQGLRDMTEEAILQKAIVLIHNRPEAYFLLSRLYEKKKDWQNSYTFAVLGLTICEFNQDPLRSDVLYPGWYGLYFQKGVAAWWVGKNEEAREIMADLKYNYPMEELFSNIVENNLNSIGYPQNTATRYTVSKYKKSMLDNIRFKFNNIETIDDNYSQSYQDMFVLSMLNGKTNGTYLEIGSADPFKSNNTALLETKFGWTGASIDFNRELVEKFMNERNNLVFCLDATQIDYTKFIDKVNLEKTIDFLQLDCDPPEQTFNILKKIPFDTHKFAVITYEHDYYVDQSIRDQSREFLKSKGYVLVANDIGYNKLHSYEDWWAHPDLIDAEVLAKMQNVTEYNLQYAGDYMFPEPTVVKAPLINRSINTVISNSKINSNPRPGFWVVDNFYKDPDAIRKFALEQEYHQGGIGRGYIGRRTFKQFLFPELKPEFERIMGREITAWEEHGMNGRFQYNTEGEPLVHHCDSQKWAAMIYLTPDAPFETGTGTHAIKKNRVFHNSQEGIMEAFRPGSQNLDKTILEPVDVIGNVYNRLVIFNAGYLHSALGYFGYNQDNCRLWQMFFFD